MSTEHNRMIREAAERCAQKNTSKLTILLPIENIGAGDAVARITRALGLDTCDSCEERRKAWNARLSFGRKG